MRILAIQAGRRDASAAAFDDYTLVAAAAEERFTRRRRDGGATPWLAIDEVLRIAGWSRRDVDAIATTQGYFPARYCRLPRWRAVYDALRGRDYGTRELALLRRRFGVREPHALFRTDRFLAENAFRPDTTIHFVERHEAHALAALFYTDWDDALVYAADGSGDDVSYSIQALRGGKLERFHGADSALARPAGQASIARGYSFAALACALRAGRDEDAVTALATQGEPRLAAQIAACFRPRDGLITADLGPADLRRRIAGICEGHDSGTVAASIQKVAEDLALQSVRFWLARADTRHLALAGGLFANAPLNRVLAESLPLDEIFVFPAMGHDGLAVGAALALLQARDGSETWLRHRRRLDTMSLGRSHDGAIDDTLQAAGMRRLPGRPAETAVDLIRAAKAGAIYAGRMEYGPRALGARSIIASPHDPAIRDSLNRRLGRAESAPFAPCVLEEDASRVLEITGVNRYAARFMTISCAVRPDWRARIPAVVQPDGTARPLLAREPDDMLLAPILRRFRGQTGLPVLINARLAGDDEPLVNRPDECLEALQKGRVDFVVTRQAVYLP